VLQWLGWTAAMLATTSPVGFVGLWMAGRLTGGQAVGASLATIVGSILSGATAYESGVNVGSGQSGWRWPRTLPATCQTPTSPGPANRERSRSVGGRDRAAQAGADRPGRPRERRGCGRAGAAEQPKPSGWLRTPARTGRSAQTTAHASPGQIATPRGKRGVAREHITGRDESTYQGESK
jgi:hypothetical protein